MSKLPEMMQIWSITKVGKPRDVLKLRSVPLPNPPKAGEIMIKIAYVSINPGEVKLMYTWMPFRGNNATPGMDFVGEIVQIGGSISKIPASSLRVGTIVAGSVPFMQIMRGVGTLGEYVVLPAHAVVEKSASLDVAVAAGLMGVAGQTCATVLHAAGLHVGDRVLLNGASGGVGTILIQVLNGMGIHVTGICSTRNEALVQRLGAKEVIDYTAHEDLCGYISSLCHSPGNAPFDSIIDCMGNMTLYYRSPTYLKPDGNHISLEGSFFQQIKCNYLPVMLGGTGRTYKSIMAYPSGALANEVADWYEKGWVREVLVDSVFSMNDAVQAFEKQATGRAVRKVFVKVI